MHKILSFNKCTYSNKHKHNQGIKNFPDARKFSCPLSNDHYFDFYLNRVVFPVLDLHINAFIIYLLFVSGHSNKCEVISHCGFDLHFPDDQ